MLVLLAAIVAVEAHSAQTVDAEALRTGKGVLVLQCGSDWCVSGESVRKAFESPAFARTKVGSQFVTAVYDDMDQITDDVRAANQRVSPILIRTKRFPAITCYIPNGKERCVFAQIENVPMSATAEKLAKAVANLGKKKDEAVALFKKAANAKNPEEAAECYGRGFDILAKLMGPFHFNELTTGNCGWRKEWDALVKLDAGDRYGWLAHFDLDEYKTVALVESVTNDKANGDLNKAKKLVAKYKAIPQNHFSPNQKQFVKILEYAISQEGTDKPLTSPQKAIMKDVYALGRDTLWGQFAMGRLMMDGEKIESKGLKHARSMV